MFKLRSSVDDEALTRLHGRAFGTGDPNGLYATKRGPAPLLSEGRRTDVTAEARASWKPRGRGLATEQDAHW